MQTEKLPKPGMMPTDMRIRKACGADAAEIEKIEAACFRSPWPIGSIKAELQKEFSQMFIAEVRSAAAGFLLVYKIGAEAEIVRLAVLGEYRRQGIAFALTERALRGFCGTVYLDVRKSNAPARALYEKAGFESYAERKKYYDDPPEDAVLMKRAPLNGNGD